MALDRGPTILEGPPPIQRRPSAEVVAGQEIGLELTAPEQSDFMLMFRELDEAEVGLVSRNIDAELRRKGEDGRLFWRGQWEDVFDFDAAEDPDNPDQRTEEVKRQSHQRAFERFLDERTKEEIDAEQEAMEKDLNNILEKIKDADVESMADMRQSFNFGRARQDLDPEAGKALAGLIDQITTDKNENRALKRQAIKVVETMIKQRIKVRQELLEGRILTYEQLDSATQARVKDWFMADRRRRDIGTIDRNETLRVLCRHKDRAPASVLKGRVRQVWGARLRYLKNQSQLKIEENEEERARLLEETNADIETVRKFTSKLSAAGNKEAGDRFERDPTGLEQIRHQAWGWIKYTIDNLRESPPAEEQERSQLGRPKKTFVYGTGAFAPESWEALNEQNTLFYQFGLARNTLKKLESLGNTEEEKATAFARDFAAVPRTEKILPTASAEAEKLFEEVKAENAEAHEKQKEVEQKLRAAQRKNALAKSQHDSAQATVNAYNKAIASGEKQEQQPDQKKGQGGKKVDQGQFNAALTKFKEAQTQLNNTEAEAQEAEEELKEINERVTASDENYHERLELINAGGISETEGARLDQAEELKKNQYKNLVKKLRAFIDQDGPRADFPSIGADKRVIERLLGMKEKEIDNPPVVYVGEGDYAFINADKIPEYSKRISSDALKQIMEHPEDYPGISQLLQTLKDQNKIVIVVSFNMTHDPEGGVIEELFTGTGTMFDQQMADELKASNDWTDDQLFEHWLDDLNLQRDLGIRPEEMEERYTAWMARNHQLRTEHLSAEDGWTVINTYISSSAGRFFDNTIRRMVDSGLPLTSDSFRQSPFYRYLDSTNQQTVTITNKSNERKVLWRNEEINAAPEAPKTVLARVYQSIKNRLELYQQHAKIGGQTVSFGDDIEKLGAFFLAHKELIEYKMLMLESIYQDPRFTDEERLERMLKWREGRLTDITDAEGKVDRGLLDLTYDLIQENGQFIDENHHPELWKFYNNTHQWEGKLERNLRESRERYAKVIARMTTHPDLVDHEEIDDAEADYLYNLGERRNFGVRLRMLGRQAAGEFQNATEEQIAQTFAREYGLETAEKQRSLDEEQMRQIFEMDDSIPLTWWERFNRRASGAIAKTKLADFGRAMAKTLGHLTGHSIGDIFLNEGDLKQIQVEIDKKLDTSLFRRAAAHSALVIQTGYQEGWRGTLRPKAKSILHPRSSAVRELTGGEGPTGIYYSPAGELAYQGMRIRVEQDVEDAISRVIGNNMHRMIKSAKDRGWNIDEIMKTFLDAKMNDTQEVELRAGQWQYNMYGREPTRISMLEELFLGEVRQRLQRPIGWRALFTPSPIDTRYVRARDVNRPLYGPNNRETAPPGSDDYAQYGPSGSGGP